MAAEGCRVARDGTRKPAGASIGITVDAGVIISRRSCLGRVASTRDLFFAGPGSLMRESRDTREPNHDRYDRNPPEKGAVVRILVI